MALVITIIVLLILAGISIGMLTGDNGIIKSTQNAKEQTEIANEKEIIDQATIEAMGRNKRGNLVEDEFQEAMDRNTKEGDTEVTDIGDQFEVYFKESNRYYMVDKNGSILDYEVAVTDPYPGDITKDENGNILTGDSEEDAYQINCIEDLVAFSNMVNNTGKMFKDSKIVDVDKRYSMSGKYIVLTRNLNFKSRASYVDSQRTDFEDINGDNTDGNVLMEELTTKIGFRPIGYPNANTAFLGNFDGKGNKIDNIYIDYSNQETRTNIALFAIGSTSTIVSNLEISGEIKGKWHTGGIVGTGAKSINNCINKANITGYNAAGGIIAGDCENLEIDNCINYGRIEITGRDWGYTGAGGIAGYTTNNQIIKNCTNKGEIIGNVKGGIVGNLRGKESNIINCINEGKAYAGIASNVLGGKSNIINCYNLGECESGIVCQFNAGDYDTDIELNIKNSYNLGKVSDSGILGRQGSTCKTSILNIENCYNAGNSDKAIIGRIYKNSRVTTNIKNCYYDSTKSNSIGAIEDGITEISIKNNSSFVDILNNNIGQNTDWKIWKLGEDGYPTF